MIGFDKFIEKMTLVDTAVCTIFMVILGGTVLNALYVLVSLPVTGLAVLAIHERGSDEYRCLKEAMKQRKREPYFDWKQMWKEVRTRYISSVILAIIWNICLYIVMAVFLMMKLGL